MFIVFSITVTNLIFNVLTICEMYVKFKKTEILSTKQWVGGGRMSEDLSLVTKRIVNDISKEILIGNLKPGDKLGEKIYAEHYGTSRAAIREALYLLSKEGLLKGIPKRGAIVQDYSEEDTYDLLVIRSMLEVLAVEKLKEVDIEHSIVKEMEVIIGLMQRDEGLLEYTELNYTFHLNLVKLSKSKPIIEAYINLSQTLKRIQNVMFSQPGNIRKSIKEHKVIFNLVKEKNIDDLKTYISSHNDNVITSIQGMLQ